jgi:hypothetical protein
MMSSAISTEQTFRPWQFFLLAGMLAATATVIVATGQSAASIVLLSLTVVAASFVGLAVYRSLAPLVSPETVQAPTFVGGRTRAALERDKALVLRSIKELEFDYAMKKVSQADFEEMRARLRGRALRIMRQLEAGEGYRSEIEQEIAARMKASSDADLTAFAEASGPTRGSRAWDPASAVKKVRATGVVCTCGTTNDPDARFCKNCGTKL